MIVTELAGMAWQVADPHARVYRPTISVNIPSAKITISRGAMNLGGKPAHVRLAFAASPPSIAVIPTTPDDTLGYTISEHAGMRRNGKPVGVHHQTSSVLLCRMLAAAGYSGTVVVPLQWHPDGMLWGDMSMATQRVSRPKKEHTS